MRKLLLAGVVIACGWLTVSFVAGAQADKPKYTTKQVMKGAQAKGGLKDKVIAGTATEDERKELIAMYEALALNKPPRGEEASWKEKTAALVEAAKSGDVEKIKAAANACMACHSAHKGKG